MDVKFLSDQKAVVVKIGTKAVDFIGNNAWDESGYGRVKQILITYGEDAINSIQMVYVQKGRLNLAPKHGGRGVNFYAIVLGSNEHVTSISGHYGVTKSTSYKVIRSLRFDTNLGSFGPFGCEEGTPFSFAFTSSSSFCGFHGFSNPNYLTAIGGYLDFSNLRTFQYPTKPRDAGRPSLYVAISNIRPSLLPP